MASSVAVARLALACALAFAVLLGLGFAVGAVAGLAWSSRDKTCALVPSKGVEVPVCEYGYHPPAGWDTR